MAEDESNFLSRWSRRKREPRREPHREPWPDPAPELDKKAATVPPTPPAAAVPDQAPAVAPSGLEESEEIDPEVVAKLPDIDSLEEASDFTPFMAKGVPEVLRRRALRKLWRLNPVFANLDGLNDYDEDFTDAATLVEGVKTVYKVGKGMLSDEDRAAAPASAQANETPETEAADKEGAEAASTDKDAEPQENASEDHAKLERVAEEPAAPEAVPLAGETAPLAAGPREETKPQPRRRDSGKSPIRSAAARRWGEPRG